MGLRLLAAMLLTTGLTLTVRAAQTTPVLRSDGPCGSLQLYFLVRDNVPLEAHYMSAAVFPEPPKPQEQTGAFTFDCPRYQATYNGKVLKITGKTIESALGVIAGANTEYTMITLASSHITPRLSTLELSCIIVKERTGTSCLKTVSGQDGMMNFEPHQPEIGGLDSQKTQAIAVRQDGGALQPAWYQGRAVPYVIDRKLPFELYLTPAVNVPFQKIRIDVSRNELTFTRTSPFPVR